MIMAMEPPVVEYPSVQTPNWNNPAVPIHRTRFMLITPLRVQLPAACVKCNREFGLTYHHEIPYSLTRSAFRGPGLPRMGGLGYYLCASHERWRIAVKCVGVAMFLL